MRNRALVVADRPDQYDNRIRKADSMDIEEIKTLTDLMVENDLSEIMIRDGEKRILLRRGERVVTQAVLPAQAPLPIAIAPSAPAPTAQQQPATAPPQEDPNLAKITSPMVGTFYAAPDPDSQPFVKVGDTVNPDTVVCVIEAMKVFNEIKAEVSGTIESTDVRNAEPVEFGQTMMTVRIT